MAKTTVVARPRALAVLLVAGVSLAACATAPTLSNRLPGKVAHGGAPSGEGGRYKLGAPYQVGGIWYVPREDPNYDQVGTASWYGDAFQARPTANGETFDMNRVSAAHATLPMPSMVEVTNLDNGKKLKVRVNDRGPFVGGRVIDLSLEAARQLGFDRQGLANVRVRYVGPARLEGGPDAGLRFAANGMPVAALPTRPIPYARLASVSAAPAAPAYAPAPSASASMAPATLPPADAPIASAPIPPATRPEVTAAITMPSNLYRVQAGAFSDAANAQRAVGVLAQAGPAVVEPTTKGKVTVYRVMLQSTADEGEAAMLRDRVVAYGFADARVVRPF